MEEISLNGGLCFLKRTIRMDQQNSLCYEFVTICPVSLRYRTGKYLQK